MYLDKQILKSACYTDKLLQALRKMYTKTYTMHVVLSLLFTLFFYTNAVASTGVRAYASASDTLRVMAFNTHHGAPKDSEDINLEAIARAIKTGQADLVALQEVDRLTERSKRVDQVKVLAKKLDMDYYFSKSIDFSGGAYGVAVLSRFPIVDSMQIMLPNTHPKGEQRSLACITVQLPDGTQLDFASVHLDLVKGNREDQAEKLKDISNKTDHPLIIAGDFNAQPQDPEIQKLLSTYQLPCAGQACPLSFPSDTPTRTIDYIFSDKKASETFTPVDYRALSEQKSSDHLPVLGVFTY